MEYNSLEEMVENYGDDSFAVLREYEGEMEMLFNCLINKVKKMMVVEGENDQLRKKMKDYQDIKQELRRLKKEVRELKRELRVKSALSESMKQEREDYTDQLKYMELINKDRDFVSKDLVYYQQECMELRKTNKDMEVTLSEQNKKLQLKLHVFEVEVEKLQKENSILKEKAVTAKINRGKLGKKNKELLEKQKRCCDLEEKLEKMTKEQAFLQQPRNIVVNVQKVSENDVAMEFEKVERLKEKLLIVKHQVSDAKQQVEKKVVIMEEKQKECEDLRHRMSRMLSPEILEEIPKCKWTIRSQHKKIQALTAAKNMYQAKAEEYKTEKEILADKAETIKKFYLNERMKNLDLREALKKTEAQEASDDRFTVTPLPPIFSEQHLQEQDQIKKTITLPPISGPVPLQSAHARPKKMMYLSAEKSDPETAQEKIQRKWNGKSMQTVLPPIAIKPLTTEKHNTNVFMTESDN